MYNNKINKYNKIIYLKDNLNKIQNELSESDNHIINEFYKIVEPIPKF